MEVALFIISVLAGGLVLGMVARWILPGEERLSLAETAIVGMLGAAVGAVLVNLTFGERDPGRFGWETALGALVGSLIVLAVVRWLIDRFGWRSEPEPTPEELIRGGESHTVEFKSTARRNLHTGERDDRIELAVARTIAGFLNGDGGTLFIGVDDDGEPIGIDSDLDLMKEPNVDHYQLWLTDHVKRTLGTPALAFVSVSFVTYRGEDVVVVKVQPSNAPVFLDAPKGQRTADFYVRMGNSTRLLLTDEFADYARSRWK